MRFAALLSVFLFLGACGAFPPYAAVEGITVMSTDKTMADHAISLASGKNCSVIRKEAGQTYCEEDENPNPVSTLYCYRTLGKITCYKEANPHNGRQRKVGENGHNFQRTP